MATRINRDEWINKVAYTVDAGCHVFLLTMKENLDLVKGELEKVEGIEKTIQTEIAEEGVKIMWIIFKYKYENLDWIENSIGPRKWVHPLKLVADYLALWT